MSAHFKDYFSEISSHYQMYRPDYPDDLFYYLSGQCHQHHLAWDCATGNGQAAKALEHYFDEIIATDASEAQIRSAIAYPKIQFRCEPAEKTTLNNHSIDLITVAQAAHWFDLARFYQEVQRVLKPQGVLAMWCYQNPKLEDKTIQAFIDELYWKITRPYWAKERDAIDEGYTHLYFPFQKIKTPVFAIQKKWTCEELLGYLSTWSGLRAFLKANKTHEQQIEKIFTEIKSTWPHTKKALEIRWPIVLLMAKIP